MGWSVIYDHSRENIIRLTLSYLTFAGIFFWFEYSRIRHIKEIRLKNQLLEGEINDRKMAQSQKEKLISELSSKNAALEKAIVEIKTLQGLINTYLFSM